MTHYSLLITHYITLCSAPHSCLSDTCFTHVSKILHRTQILDAYLISPHQYTLVSQTLEYLVSNFIPY